MQKVWLITGASRGIGKAIVAEAAAGGDVVFAGVRGNHSLSDLLAEFPDSVFPIPLDVNRPEEVSASVAEVLKRFGRLDVLVNNAGYGLHGMIEEVTMEQVRKQMETNFFGLLDLTQKVIPVMRQQRGGYIVNISSIAGLRGASSFGLYNASKFAVNGLSEALAQEMEPFGVWVSCVEPGPYRTDWAGSSLERADHMEQLRTDSPYYEENLRIKTMMDERSGKQPGDPVQIAKVLYSAAHSAGKPPVHLVFGDVAVDLFRSHREKWNDPSFMREYPYTRTSI